MKKILLATTVLVGTAGFAAAEVTFSGSASVGVARDNTDTTSATTLNDGEYHAYAAATLTFGATVETDSGLTLAVTSDADLGTSYDFGDGDDEGFNAADAGSFGAPSVSVAGAFGKLTIALDDIDNLYDDDLTAGDFQYDYSVGDLSLAVAGDIEGVGETSAKVGYVFNGVTVGAAYDTADNYSLSLGYGINGVTATVTLDRPFAGTTTTELALAYEANGFSGSVSLVDDSTWELGAGYTANGLTVGATLDDADAWSLTASYDLGAGASVEGGINSADDVYAGVGFSF